MRRLTGDDGMAAVTVAIAGTVLIGMVAFALDVGALYAERRELQNGADAAALAVAQACADGDLSCTPVGAPGIADAFADDNAGDGAAGVDTVDLDLTSQTIGVVTSTEDTSGGTLLPSWFAGVLGFDGSTVRAAASAAWGFPRAIPRTLPLIISDCEWVKFSPGIQEPPFSGPPAVIYFHGSAETCHASPSGQDMPGGFGWLDTIPGQCATSIAVNDWVAIDTGASPSTACDPPDLESLVGTAVPIPFFDDIMDTGSNATYHVAGFGALHVTGYNFGGGFKYPSGSTAPCGGSDRCIAGYFTTTTLSMGEIGGEDRGIVIVKLTG